MKRTLLFAYGPPIAAALLWKNVRWLAWLILAAWIGLIVFLKAFADSMGTKQTWSQTLKDLFFPGRVVPLAAWPTEDTPPPSPDDQLAGTINFLPAPRDPNYKGYDGSGINWQLGQRHY